MELPKKKLNVSIYQAQKASIDYQHGKKKAKTFFSLHFCVHTVQLFYHYLQLFVFQRRLFIPEPLVREKLMSGKLLIEWRHDLCAEITKKRYINDQELMRLAHAEIVNLFFPLETSDESDEINSETSDKSSEFLS